MSYKVVPLDIYTADAGYKIVADTFEDLLNGCIESFLETICDKNSVGDKETKEISLIGDSDLEKIYNFLNDLIYLLEVDCFLPRRCKIENAKIVLFGDKLDVKKHKIYSHIKAITKHDLKLEIKDSKYILTLLYDV